MAGRVCRGSFRRRPVSVERNSMVDHSLCVCVCVCVMCVLCVSPYVCAVCDVCVFVLCTCMWCTPLSTIFQSYHDCGCLLHETRYRLN